MKSHLILILAFICVGSGCSQKKDNKTKTMIFDELKNYEYLNDSRPGYYLQVNNQNCHYEIRVNDRNGGLFYDPYPAYSVRIPLNLDIFKSGTQKLSVKVLPNNGKMLSERASMELRLMLYPDMTDPENDYGGSTVLWEWSMPDILNQELPIVAFDTVFEADVPYKIDILEKYAADLTEMDEDVLIKEVLTEFEKRHLSIKNDNQDLQQIKESALPAFIQIYADKEKIDASMKSTVASKPNEVLQPLENYQLRLYADGKMATLLSNNDLESAIWWADKDTGEAIGWQPLYVFKNKNTGEWHVW